MRTFMRFVLAAVVAVSMGTSYTYAQDMDFASDDYEHTPFVAEDAVLLVGGLVAAGFGEPVVKALGTATVITYGAYRTNKHRPEHVRQAIDEAQVDQANRPRVGSSAWALQYNPGTDSF